MEFEEFLKKMAEGDLTNDDVVQIIVSEAKKTGIDSEEAFAIAMEVFRKAIASHINKTMNLARVMLESENGFSSEQWGAILITDEVLETLLELSDSLNEPRTFFMPLARLTAKRDDCIIKKMEKPKQKDMH